MRWTNRVLRTKSVLCMNSPGDGVEAEGEIEQPTGLRTTAPEVEPGAPTDLELMQAIQAEDPEALSQLYDRYNGILKALILRVDS